ncbi:hypothetical protein RB195_018011 [Necator americanus]|uniref:Uncharacterized protein n=1 Tax=Necator americanus TaxID=51031 RepID=A0ABR1C7S5_NECAM
MKTFKLQLDYVLTMNIPQSDIRKSRAVWDVASDSDHRQVLSGIELRLHKRNRRVPPQPKIDKAGVKDGKCRTNFRVCLFMLKYGLGRSFDADSFTKCTQDAARETLTVQMPRKNFAFASAETRFTYNSVCVALAISTKKAS